MANSNSANAAERCGPLASPDPGSPASRAGLADPDETTPLLHINRAHGNHSDWWSSARSTIVVSSLYDKNAGLLLVAASQFFYSAMNISVKWLNSLDDPVPTLEVCLLQIDVPGDDFTKVRSK